MSTNQIFGKAASMVTTMIVTALAGAASAQAACDYGDPTVSLSIRSPGSNAGVEVAVARISASASSGSLRSGSSSSCSSSSYTTSYVYIDNRYIGQGTFNWNTAEVADGIHILRVDASDNNGGRTSVQQRITVRNNWIRPEVWNFNDYLALNPDVAGAYGGDPGRTLSHWLYFGVREGRQASLTFSAIEYSENNGDIAAAFGANYPVVIDHYINFGIREGRVTLFALRPEVFNVHYYYALYPDLQAAFPGDANETTRHWLRFGVMEGRRGVQNFAAPIYMQRYGDLQAAFGPTNYKAGIKHYLQYGISEGRSGQ